jgi:hypothetical protein
VNGPCAGAAADALAPAATSDRRQSLDQPEACLRQADGIALHGNMRVHVVEFVVEILELIGEHERPLQAMLEGRTARRCVLLNQVGAGDCAIRQPRIALTSPPDLSFGRMKAQSLSVSRDEIGTGPGLDCCDDKPRQHPRLTAIHQELCIT